MQLISFFLIVISTLVTTQNAIAESTSAEAEKLFISQCSKCHEIGEDAVNSSGPHLNKLFGRKLGSVNNYRYSDSLTLAGELGKSWSTEALSSWLKNPVEYLQVVTKDEAAHSRMAYRVTDENNRNLIINYLRSLPEINVSNVATPNKCFAKPQPSIDFRNCDLVRVDFSNVDLSNAQLQNTNLISANLKGANLSGANLSGASLGGSDLRGADFTNANLSDSTMVKALIPGAGFEGAILNNTIYVNAKRCAPESVGECL